MTPKGAEPDAEVLADLAIHDTVRASGYLRKYPNATRVATLGSRETALHWAVMKRSESAARFLLARGADVNALDAAGGTPLLYAVQNRDDGIVDVLLRAGADVTLQNQHGETPLLFAIEQGRSALCKALIAAGARLPLSGEPPLQSAVTSHQARLVELSPRDGAGAGDRPTRVTASKAAGLLSIGLAAALTLYAATVFFWPSMCQFWPVDQGEGRCLALVAHTGQGGRCRVIDTLLYQIKHNKSDVVISGALDGLASAGSCSDIAFLLQRVPLDAPRRAYHLTATAFEACEAARPYSENLLAREKSTPTFDQAELRHIANGSPCN